ncbi:MAG: tyrosine--tRNA ligase [Candidatus Bathyarchaeia archaeon]
MDVETRFELIKRVGEEIITEEELRHLLETKHHPIAYDGFEPSGIAHLAFAVYRAINLEDLLEAGVKFKLWLADWFAWINNKMGGDLEKIRLVGEYFTEVWKAAGVDMDKVEVLWASENMDREYWKRVILIAKNTTLTRMFRCLTIMGRKKGELQETSQLFYPAMQVSDIFQLECDICQLGLDQRRANILAREIGPKIGLWKPVCVHHHILMGLQGLQKPQGFDARKDLDVMISSKMSKSKPQSCIYIHDSEDEIRKKIYSAFCPPKVVHNNPILDYLKHIVFRKFDTLEIKREAKYGGYLEVQSYEELEGNYRRGEIHPLDLKNTVAEKINELITPIREHFEKDKKARRLYEIVKQQEITR